METKEDKAGKKVLEFLDAEWRKYGRVNWGPFYLTYGWYIFDVGLWIDFSPFCFHVGFGFFSVAYEWKDNA